MKKSFYTLSMLFALAACNPEQNPASQEQTILLNSDSESLNKRLNLDGAGVINIANPNIPENKVLEELAGNIPLVLVSQVDPPTYDGKTLKASHVDIEGNYAYVGYNKPGEVFLGGVEVYDITDPNKPKITAQAIFKNAKINSVNIENGKLYLAGAFDIDAEPNIATAAQFVSVSVANGQFTSDFFMADIDGFAAVDVSHTPNHVVVATGSNGVIGLFESNRLVSAYAFEDIRATAYGNGLLAALSGREGIVLLNPTNLQLISKIETDRDVDESKRTLDMGPDVLYTSEGKKGAGIYRLPSGEHIKQIGISYQPERVLESEIVTNAVSYDDGLLLMANGGAGVSVIDVSDVNDIKEFGVISLFGSSNFVKLHGEHIFVANGNGGLQILKVSRNNQASNQSAACLDLIPYTGNSSLNINSNQTAAYSGSASLKNVNIGGSLLFCGSMAIENSLNINSNGIFEMNGTFAFGQYKKNNSISINNNAVLKISGNAVIYGDINLNSGSTLEFIGENNSITVFGNVRINNNVTIKGNFTDTEGKLK